MDTGIDAAIVETAFELAMIQDIPIPTLGRIAENLALIGTQTSGIISIQSLKKMTGEAISGERLQTLLYAFIQAGVLIRRLRDRRGAQFDEYSIDRERLFQLMHDLHVARYILGRGGQTDKEATDVTLLATLPDSLEVIPAIRKGILPVSVALHRLITGARQEVIILNPFFEQEGFDRLASALLAAARKDVDVVIISRALTWKKSENSRVMGRLATNAIRDGLHARICMYQYQRLEGRKLAVTSHAKILVADHDSAYLGSANLTEYGMDRYLEMGTLVTGSVAAQIRQVLHSVLTSSDTEEVPLHYLAGI